MKYSLRYNGGTPDLITNPGYENKKTLTDKTVENYNPKQLEFDFKSDEDANKDPNILRRIKHYTEKYDGVNLGKDYEKAIAEEDKKLAKLGPNKNILQRNNDPYLKKLKGLYLIYLLTKALFLLQHKLLWFVIEKKRQ